MTAPARFSIGRLAKAADVKIPTIRFYEQIALLPTAARSDSDRRLYDEAAVRRLGFIKRARQLGFSIESIRTLLDLSDHPERPCGEANIMATEQLAAVSAKIAGLQALQVELARIAASGCDGRVAECRVIEALGDHDLYLSEHDAPAGELN